MHRRRFLHAAGLAIVAGRLVRFARSADAEPAPRTHADAIRAALEDSATLDPETAGRSRYLSAHHLADPAELAAMGRVVSFHVNSLSRAGAIVRPVAVTDWLWRIDLGDYEMDPFAFARIVFKSKSTIDGEAGIGLQTDPYFHARVSVDGKTFVASAAPWLPADAIQGLATLCQSAVPIYRADHFLHRTAIQEGRTGFGYYDQLRIASRDDVDKLTGLDRPVQAKVNSDRFAKIAASGVATAGERQLARFQAPTGGYWFSLDAEVDTLSQAERNALRLYFGDYKHQGEEGIATLPNGLAVAYVSDAAGKFVASAPPTIAVDHKSGSNDRRVHPYLSCVRCHTDAAALIPFDDWERPALSAGGGLKGVSPDKATERRINAAYIRAVKPLYDEDVRRFERAIEETGADPKTIGREMADQWARYTDRRLTIADAAAEVGTTPDDLTARLADYLARLRKAGTPADPVLASLTRRGATVSRNQFEELFPLLMFAVGYPGVRK